MEDNKTITYFAKTNFRNEQIKFGIKKKDRTRHTYIIGKTGTGKTTLQENMAIQDIRNGEGVAVIDPHGSFVEKMLDYIPKERIEDVIYIDPSDMDHPIALNIMEDVDGDQMHLVASGLMGVFKKMWPDVWSARMEYILNNTLLALLEYPNATLLGVNRMFSDKDYRKAVVENIKDPIVKDYWTREYAGYTERFAAEATPAIQNKIGQFTSNPLVRNIIGQPKSSFSFRQAMDEKKIVLINLSKGRIGELNSSLLGALLVTKIYLASMSRAKEPEKEFSDFYFYVDEFQNFAAESFENILSESRKYGLALVLAHQYITQMPDGVKDAVFGNVGTHIVFRVGPEDAKVLEIEFAPEFTADDIVNLGFTNIYLKLLIDGEPSRPFSATTLPPFEKNIESYKEQIIEYSREKYCTPIEDIEKQIAEWHAPIEGEKGKDNKSPEEKKEAPKLFEAACSICGKKTVVPFEPIEGKPIYCKKHRAYITEGGGSTEVPAKPKKERVSLSQLDGGTKEFRREPLKKREKSTPDFKGLRELLADVAPKKTSDEEMKQLLKETPKPKSDQGAERNEAGNPKPSKAWSGKEKPLKPGDTIKF